ncbi:MAG: CRISPR-associated protein Cas4 [Smithella sp. SDB]|nr:MAG: CRISPR-associated protein Cas4 [Smithella sp. SDB]
MPDESLIRYEPEELVPISALTQYAYCPRRCALIHIEQMWEENIFTAEGRIMHEHVHDEGDESRGDVRIEHGASLRSLRLGLIGKADVIEYHRQNDGTWQAFPVEYKRGKPKPDDSDKIQLCAQAICLEEMLNVHIPAGALFYGKTRRRLDVDFDEALRRETQDAAQKTHELIDAGITPAPVYTNRCESCSLMAECMPKTIQKKRTVESYLKRMLDET